MESHFPNLALKMMKKLPKDGAIQDFLTDWYLEEVQNRGKFIAVGDQDIDAFLIPILCSEVMVKGTIPSTRVFRISKFLLDCYTDVEYISPLQLLVPLRLIWLALRYILEPQIQNGKTWPELFKKYEILPQIETCFRQDSVLNLGMGYAEHFLFTQMDHLSKFLPFATDQLLEFLVDVFIDMFTFGKHPHHLFRGLIQEISNPEKNVRSPKQNSRTRLEFVSKVFHNAIVYKTNGNHIPYTYGFSANLEIFKFEQSFVGQSDVSKLYFHTGLPEIDKDEWLQELNHVLRAHALLSNYGFEEARRLLAEKPRDSKGLEDKLSVETGDFFWNSKVSESANMDSSYVNKLMKETIQSVLPPLVYDAIEKSSRNPLLQHIVLHFPDLLLSEVYFSKSKLFEALLKFDPHTTEDTAWLDFLTIKACSLLSIPLPSVRTEQNYFDFD